MSSNKPRIAEADAFAEAGAGRAQGQELGSPQTSYRQIMKSSVLIGGSSFLSIAIGAARSKVMAVLLGSEGFGLLGLYSSIVDLTLSVAALGIGSSGVRQIAESASTGDEVRIARTVTVLRKTALLLGIIAALIVAGSSEFLSDFTFGGHAHSGALTILGLTVFLRLVSSGQSALIQGMRRIRDLAAMNILGALLGAFASTAMVYAFGEKGVAPSLAGGAAITVVTSWWYSRKVKIHHSVMTPSEVVHEAAALLRLGFAFMVSSVAMMGASYAVRTILLRMDGLEAAGLYSAAWTLGGLYVGIILQAMGADFYPRLVGVVQKNVECCRLVNEQTQVSLLLAGPGVIATIAFAPLIIEILYSADFSGATGVTRWICLGIALRAITWPMGFIIVAQNRQALFVMVDVAWALANVGLTIVCVQEFGLDGAGVAFFASYAFHGVLVYLIVNRINGFRWSRANYETAAFILGSVGIVFGFLYLSASALGVSIAAAVFIFNTMYSIRRLWTLLSPTRIPHFVRGFFLLNILKPRGFSKARNSEHRGK